MADDLYGILGVSKTATADEIKSAYRQKAKQFHPDMLSHASDAEKKKAEEQFKKINEAYSVLSDDQKRKMYDTYGTADPQQAGAGGFWNNAGGGQGVDFDLGDIFSSFFGGGFGGSGRKSNVNRQAQGEDIVVSLNITFLEAAFGCEKDVKVRRRETCSECGGNGAKGGTAVKTCPRCGGKGVVSNVQQTVFGQFATQTTCPDCKGKGKIISENCPKCNGKGYNTVDKTIRVNVPAGIDDGQRMTYYNEGEAGVNGGPNGSLIVLIKVKPHKYFVRKGADLYLDFPISVTQAALGANVKIPTLTTPVEMDIPEGTQNGTVFRLKGQGIKYLKNNSRGDIYVTVTVEIPKGLSKEQRELMFKFESSATAKQYPKRTAFKDKM